MKRGKRIFLIILSTIVVIGIGAALYANHWLNNLVEELNAQIGVEGFAEVSTTPGTSETESPKDSTEASSFIDANSNESIPQQSDTTSDNIAKDSNKTQTTTSNAKIVASVQQQLDKPIEKSDLLQAGFMVLRKLSASEINFLFGFSDKEYTKEELIKAREVLLNKFNAEDIKILRTLGRKYGKKLDILDPSVEIR